MTRVAYPDMESPTDNFRIALIIQGVRKKFGKVVKRRMAMTADIIKEVLIKCLDPGLQLLTLTQLRFATIVFTMYFGAMQAEEALELLTEKGKPKWQTSDHYVRGQMQPI